jgi:hypothetical protein
VTRVEHALRELGAVKVARILPERFLSEYYSLRPALLDEVEGRWIDGVMSGTEAPNFIDVDISLAPPLHEFTRDIRASMLGPSYGESHRLTDVKLRFVATSPLGYLNWHVDHFDGPGTFIKVLVYLDDVAPGDGDFCYVVGSHRERVRGSDEQVAACSGYRRFPSRAGGGVVFDSAGVHAPSPNNGGALRQTLHLAFARW